MPLALWLQQSLGYKSVIVPPEAKFGLSDSHGSGHWYPLAIRSATCSRMALSWMSTKTAGELPVVLDQPVPNPEDIHDRPTLTYHRDLG